MNKTFPTHDSLVCLAGILSSHDDFSVVEDLYAGFDSSFNLIILCEHTDYDNPRNNCATWAQVSKDEAFQLSRKLNVPLAELPEYIGESMAEGEGEEFAMPGDVRDRFKSVTDCLLAEGCHFRIHRRPASDGYVSC